MYHVVGWNACWSNMLSQNYQQKPLSNRTEPLLTTRTPYAPLLTKGFLILVPASRTYTMTAEIAWLHPTRMFGDLWRIECIKHLWQTSQIYVAESWKWQHWWLQRRVGRRLNIAWMQPAPHMTLILRFVREQTKLFEFLILSLKTGIQ